MASTQAERGAAARAFLGSRSAANREALEKLCDAPGAVLDVLRRWVALSHDDRARVWSEVGHSDDESARKVIRELEAAGVRVAP